MEDRNILQLDFYGLLQGIIDVQLSLATLIANLAGCDNSEIADAFLKVNEIQDAAGGSDEFLAARKYPAECLINAFTRPVDLQGPKTEQRFKVVSGGLLNNSMDAGGRINRDAGGGDDKDRQAPAENPAEP